MKTGSGYIRVNSDQTTEETWNPYPADLVALLAITIFLISMIVFGITAFRTVTWWDNAEYSLAAKTLGVAHPPGSLLLTLLGYVVVHLPLGIQTAFVLNLFAGFLGAITVIVIFLITVHLLRFELAVFPRDLQIGAILFPLLGAFISSLIFAFSETVWQYSVKFTPYILTALFTVMILFAILRWWNQPDSPFAYWWLFGILLLFALDFSVHRTNLLLFPGFIIVVLIRSPQTFLRLHAWLSALGGLILGLSFHLLLIPMAAHHQYLNFGDPSNLARFWDYVTLKQAGGGWLISLFPRTAPFWKYQIMDYLRSLGINFFNYSKWFGVFGYFPGILALIGFVFMWIHRKRLAIAMTILFLFSSLGMVIYLNLPQDFYRPVARHYLPSFVFVAIWIAYGSGTLLINLWKHPSRLHSAFSLIFVLLLVGTAVAQLTQNYKSVDGSKRTFAEDFARDFLLNLPPNAILFTGGDIDTFPLWYLQAADGVRQDITICNLSLLNSSWFIHHLMHLDANIPLNLSPAEIDQLRPIAWKDSTVSLPAPENIEKANPSGDSSSLHVTIPPLTGSKILLVQDQIVLQIIRQNHWKRPLYISNLAGGTTPNWLAPLLSTEGVVSRIIPIKHPSVNVKILSINLLSKYQYRGYANPSLPVDQPMRWASSAFYRAFITLGNVLTDREDIAQCSAVKNEMLVKLPPERLQPSEGMLHAISAMCGQQNE